MFNPMGTRSQRRGFYRSLSIAGIVIASLSACSRETERRYEWRGEELRLKETPRRIVAANAGCAEYVLELVPADRIAALPEEVFEFAAVPPDPIAWPAARRIPRYEAEAVLAHGPDLVLATPWQPAEITAALRRLNVPVLLVPEVRELDDARDILFFLGRIFEREERAQEVWNATEARAAALQRSAPATKPRVLPYANLGDGGWTAGRETTLDLALRLAGFQNLAADAGFVGHQRIDLEAFAHLNPDWIVISTEEADGFKSPTFAALEAAPLTRTLPAVREGRVLRLPSRLSGATTHRIVDAAEFLQASYRSKQGE